MDKNKEKMVFAIALQFGKGALDTINIFGGIDGQKQSKNWFLPLLSIWARGVGHDN